MILIGKLYRLCTDTAEAITGSRRNNLWPLKPFLDEWENALKDWLSEPWIATLNTAQLDAIYSVLYSLAQQVFELNAQRKSGDTCQPAVETTVRADLSWMHLADMILIQSA